MTKSSPSSSPPTSSSPGDVAGESGGEPAGEPGHELDLCGELCPFTFVRTKLALEDLPMGARLRVTVDHEPATRNIPRSAAEWGQDVIGVTRLSPRTWAIDLRKRVR
ncbi:MAG TPA: sulfurtransferase TusA family protein [Kofleriaceae bacterium]|nr:sulfurtransferase TusA family protein [Kofleriaceae bacterium]